MEKCTEFAPAKANPVFDRLAAGEISLGAAVPCMILQIHDELLFDVLPAEADELQILVKQEMEHVATFTVPIFAELALDPNWRDVK
jgi:DNA polymerase I-like protein with 3'-5' exonuclease and polymerase domains